jgi:hypothetical protein
VDRILVQVGQLVAENYQFVEVLAGIANGIANVVHYANKLPGAGQTSMVARTSQVGRGVAGRFIGRATPLYDTLKSDINRQRAEGNEAGSWAWLQLAQQQMIAEAEARTATERQRRRGGRGRGASDAETIQGEIRRNAVRNINPYATGWDNLSEDRARPGNYFEVKQQAARDDLAQIFAGSDALQRKAAGIGGELERDRKRSILADIFGEPQEFDLYRERFEMLGGAVEVFSGALASGFDAWVSGSKSATEALKGLVGDTLKGLATTLFAKAIEHGAAAIGSLASGNPVGAAAHGKAAAAYGAGAVVVGGFARQFGGGGVGGGAGGAKAPTVTGPYQGGGGQSSTTIVLGDSMADESPMWRARKTARALSQAERFRHSDRNVVHA